MEKNEQEEVLNHHSFVHSVEVGKLSVLDRAERKRRFGGHVTYAQDFWDLPYKERLWCVRVARLMVNIGLAGASIKEVKR